MEVFSALVNIPWNGIVGSYGKCIFNFVYTAKLFTKWAIPFSIPFASTPVIFFFLLARWGVGNSGGRNFRQSDGYVMMCYYDLNLSFPND